MEGKKFTQLARALRKIRDAHPKPCDESPEYTSGAWLVEGQFCAKVAGLDVGRRGFFVCFAYGERHEELLNRTLDVDSLVGCSKRIAEATEVAFDDCGYLLLDDVRFLRFSHPCPSIDPPPFLPTRFWSLPDNPERSVELWRSIRVSKKQLSRFLQGVTWVTNETAYERNGVFWIDDQKAWATSDFIATAEPLDVEWRENRAESDDAEYIPQSSPVALYTLPMKAVLPVMDEEIYIYEQARSTSQWPDKRAVMVVSGNAVLYMTVAQGAAVSVTLYPVFERAKPSYYAMFDAEDLAFGLNWAETHRKQWTENPSITIRGDGKIGMVVGYNEIEWSPFWAFERDASADDLDHVRTSDDAGSIAVRGSPELEGSSTNEGSSTRPPLEELETRMMTLDIAKFRQILKRLRHPYAKIGIGWQAWQMPWDDPIVPNAQLFSDKGVRAYIQPLNIHSEDWKPRRD